MKYDIGTRRDRWIMGHKAMQRRGVQSACGYMYAHLPVCVYVCACVYVRVRVYGGEKTNGKKKDGEEKRRSCDRNLVLVLGSIDASNAMDGLDVGTCQNVCLVLP